MYQKTVYVFRKPLFLQHFPGKQHLKHTKQLVLKINTTVPAPLPPGGEKRYARQVILEGFGREGQEKLAKASVLVVGAGGLGCPVLQYLAAAGTGHIGIVDGDTVSITNLHRQVLYHEGDCGQKKAETAAQRLKAMNPHVRISVCPTNINTQNVLCLVGQYDLVVDCTDNFPTRYLLNDACVMLGKPLVYGAIHKFEGQVSVFNYQDGPTYRCLFPEAPLPGEVPDCATAGVLGVLPGLVGAWQATEAIKIITGLGKPLSGELLSIDTLTGNTFKFRFKKSTAFTPVSRLLEYYGPECAAHPQSYATLTSDELKQWMDTAQDFLLLDVREAHEFMAGHIEGAQNLPLPQIAKDLASADLFSKNKTVVYCQSGGRSV